MTGLHATTVAGLADRLLRAESDRVAIDPLTAADPNLSIEDAHAIQTYNVNRRIAAGAVIRGRKLGLTWRPVQELLSVHEPNFGVLLDDMFVDESGEVRFDSLIQPRVESEIAFLMARDLAGPGVTTTGALVAVAGVLPAVEGRACVKRSALNIHEPVFGRLTSGMVVPHGEVVHLGELIAARAEPEIALLMAQRVQAPTTIAAVVLGFAQPHPAQTTTRAANESATDNQGKGT
jgi:2-keto-4-pentenoate hydratase